MTTTSTTLTPNNDAFNTSTMTTTTFSNTINTHNKTNIISVDSATTAISAATVNSFNNSDTSNVSRKKINKGKIFSQITFIEEMNCVPRTLTSLERLLTPIKFQYFLKDKRKCNKVGWGLSLIKCQYEIRHYRDWKRGEKPPLKNQRTNKNKLCFVQLIAAKRKKKKNQNLVRNWYHMHMHLHIITSIYSKAQNYS